MNKKIKSLLIPGLVILGVLLLGGLFIFRGNKQVEVSEQADVVVPDKEVETLSVTSTVTSTTSTPVIKRVIKPKTTTANVKEAIYSEVMKKYDKYRFQFSSNCSEVFPKTFVIKKDLLFMIDNREDKPHVFSFGNQKYSVKPYGYVLINAQPVGNNFILCDGIQRASVTVF